MTSPLRQMTAAARAMARGDYSRRVRATSRDEIGQLATAFNQMAADLGAADEYRRGLIANVSHELRTPITALHARARERRRRHRRTRRRDDADGAVADRTAQRTGGQPARPVARSRAASIPCSPVHSASASFCGRPSDTSRRRPTASTSRSGCRRRTWSRSPIRPGCGRWWSIWWTTRFGTARQVAGCPCSRVAAEPSGLRLEVCDEGPGIPPAERERVFQRFTRGATSAGGTGLGLAIARWAVELHGGAIEVMDAGPVAESGSRSRPRRQEEVA